MMRLGSGSVLATASERGEGKAEGERKRKADVPMAPRSPAAAAVLAAGASGAKRRSSPVLEARLLPQFTHSCRLDVVLSAPAAVSLLQLRCCFDSEPWFCTHALQGDKRRGHISHLYLCLEYQVCSSLMGTYRLRACVSAQAAASAPSASAAESPADPGAAAANALPVAGPSAFAQGAAAHPAPAVRGAPGEPSGRTLRETSSGAPCSPDPQETVQLSSRAAGTGVTYNPKPSPVPRAAPLPLPRRRPLADLGADRRPALAGGAGAGSGFGEGVRAGAGPDPGVANTQDDDPDETVPLVNGGLAQRALRGRQSIAPGRVRSSAPRCNCMLLTRVLLGMGWRAARVRPFVVGCSPGCLRPFRSWCFNEQLAERCPADSSHALFSISYES